MSRRAARTSPREQRRTILLVGEGLEEQYFLSHLKSLYVVRGAKSVTIKNAKGKGGRHVLDYTLRQRRQAAYEQVGVLLDTDADWSAQEQARARRAQVQVFESVPCLEAMLLRMANHPVPAGDGAAIKRAFQGRFGDSAHSLQLYQRHFDRGVLESASSRLPVLAALLSFLQG